MTDLPNLHIDKSIPLGLSVTRPIFRVEPIPANFATGTWLVFFGKEYQVTLEQVPYCYHPMPVTGNGSHLLNKHVAGEMVF